MRAFHCPEGVYSIKSFDVVVVDGGQFSAELGDPDGNETVDVSLVNLGQHLVHIALDVRGDGCEVWSVVDHGGVGDDGGGVLGSSIHQFPHIRVTQFPLQILGLVNHHRHLALERPDIEFFPNVAFLSRLNGVRFLVMSFEAAEHATGPGVDGEDSLVSLHVLVDEAIRLYCGLKLEINPIDGDVFFAEREAWINVSVQTSLQIVVLAGNLDTSQSRIFNRYKTLVACRR